MLLGLLGGTLQILSTKSFAHPITRRAFERAHLVALDEYLAANGLPAHDVAFAFDAARGDSSGAPVRRAVVERLPTTRDLLRTPALAKAQSESLSRSRSNRAAAKERAKAAKAKAEKAQLDALAAARKAAFEERKVRVHCFRALQEKENK